MLGSVDTIHNDPMVERSRLALRIGYLGGGFHGWQRQRGERTVQGELERALARLYGTAVELTGAGRTDAGVHAAGQIAHLDPPLVIPASGVLAALNTMLPPDVRVLAARPVEPDFHARASARGKRYRYRLAWGRPLPPWDALRTWLLPAPPELSEMAEALALVTGEHDFAAFALSGHSGTGKRGTHRTIATARLTARRRRAAITLEGDGFLRGMVRRITGALVEVGRGAAPPDWVASLLADPATRPPAPTAPPHGLTLERVLYDL